MEIVEYRAVVGYEGYRVGDDGSIWSCRKWNRWHGTTLNHPWRKLKPVSTKAGYTVVNMAGGPKTQQKVHQVVLEAFVGPRPGGMQTRHKNGIRNDNRRSNLCWGTAAENKADRVAHGTIRRGVDIPWVKLTEQDIREIRELHAKGVKRPELSRRFKVNTGTLHYIIHRKRWVHVD